MKKIFTFIFSICFFISNSQTTLVSEDFSSGMIPSSWTVNTFPNNTCGNFQYQSSQTWPTSTITGPHMSAWSYTPQNGPTCQSGSYVLIPFSGSGFTSIDIDVDQYFYNWNNNDSADVYYSSDNGTTWNLLQTWTGVGPTGPLNYTIGMPNLSSNMVFALQHRGYDGYGWDIDNIVITGNGSVGSGCTHTFNMYDEFDDGWDGASVNVTVNGTTVVSSAAGLPGGSGMPAACGTENFQASAGDAIALTNWVSGSYNSEISWDIKDGNGTVIASGGTMVNGGGFGTPSTCTGDCGGGGPSPSWDCDATNGTCSDPGTGLGQHPTQAICQSNCVVSSWECVSGSCSDPGNGSGPYPTQAACLAQCVVTPTWDCVSANNCQDPGTGLGQYPTEASCLAQCLVNPSWDCVSANNCQDPGTGLGQYPTQSACLAQCVVTWECTGIGNCIDPNDGTGSYSTQAACLAQCVSVAANSFSASITAACVGDIIQFTNSSTGNPLNYTWDFGDGSSSVQPNPSHQYTSAGSYSITLIVSNTYSADTIVQNNYIVVIDAVDAAWTSNPSGQANIGQSISFSASSGAPTTWEWNWDDGTINGLGQNETHSYPNTGVYDVCLSVSNSCSSDDECQPIEIFDPCLSSSEIYLTNIAFTSSVNEVGTLWETEFNGLPTSLVKPTSNPLNLLNPGMEVSFKIECRNEKANGQAIVSGMCEIISSDPYITIIDGDAGLNNVGWQNEAWSTDEFIIEISSNAPAGYLANIEFKVIEGSITEYTRCVKIPVQPLIVSNMDIDDDSNPDSNGDDDNICEPGETIEVFPYVDNVSLLEADLVAGSMKCLDTNINIWDGKSGISGIVEKDVWWNVSFGNPGPILVGAAGMTPEFDFVFDYNLNQVTPVPLTIVFTGGFQLFDINGSTKSALIRFSSDYYINNGILNSAEGIETNNLIKIFPNPFKKIVTIEVNTSEPYNLRLYNIMGEILKDYKNINNDKLVIERGSLKAGVYLLTIITDIDIRTERLIIE